MPELLFAGLLLAVFMNLVLLTACVIDDRYGEPAAALHPVVWMGHYLQWCGGWFLSGVLLAPIPAFIAGMVFWLVGAVGVGLLGWGIQVAALGQIARFYAAPSAGGAGAVIATTVLFGWALKCMLSWRMLRDEVAAVEQALQQSVAAGRDRLGWLVSRDTTILSESEVRESAIESLAENLNDSVVAPIFWFVLFGLPGAAVYRFANTADAMWGYRGVRNGVHWEWAGKWAAWADDVLSWLPARLTALLLALVAPGVRLASLRLEARKTPSPNSGWPMAAMALALGVCLHKPGVYALNSSGVPPQAASTSEALKYASKVVKAAVLCAFLAITLIAFIGIY